MKKLKFDVKIKKSPMKCIGVVGIEVAGKSCFNLPHWEIKNPFSKDVKYLAKNLEKLELLWHGSGIEAPQLSDFEIYSIGWNAEDGFLIKVSITGDELKDSEERYLSKVLSMLEEKVLFEEKDDCYSVRTWLSKVHEPSLFYAIAVAFGVTYFMADHIYIDVKKFLAYSIVFGVLGIATGFLVYKKKVENKSSAFAKEIEKNLLWLFGFSFYSLSMFGMYFIDQNFSEVVCKEEAVIEKLSQSKGKNVQYSAKIRLSESCQKEIGSDVVKIVEGGTLNVPKVVFDGNLKNIQVLVNKGLFTYYVRVSGE